MCGVTGLLLARHTKRKHLSFVEQMAEAIRHRGPNGAGVWSDRDAGIALAHRRLAIVDLSQAGHQPMLSRDGNLVLSYNGEIYNIHEIRTDLRAAGYTFRGTSDTEVMLAAFEKYGVESALIRFVGMFAFALWDRRTRTLHFARDRIGKKPLFIASTGKALLFGSELKSILAHPLFDSSINATAASTMLAQGWIPENSCIFENVIKMAPGGLLSVKENDVSHGITHLRSLTQIWWSLRQCAVTNAALIQSTSADNLDAELEHLLLTSVRQRMLADVPVGALLSGGVDSSLVVSLMQAQSTRAVQTFTASFTESDFDEGSDAKRIADFLGTAHTELKVTAKEALDVVPALPQVWDEPFADESQIPTLLLSRLVSKHVTVALSGDGGDESFAGYARYKTANHLNLLFSMPGAFRGFGGSILELLSPACTELALASIKSTKRIRYSDFRKFASAIKAAEESEFYDRLVSYCADVSPCRYRHHVYTDSVLPLSDPLSRLIFRDMKAYLPSDILVKLDRASMAAGLETRCPLLDQRVIEFAWRIPTREKLHDGENKRILRRILARYLPDELIKKPKMGFDVPIAAWLAGPLRDWAISLLDPKSLKDDSILDEKAVALLWRRFQHGRTDLAYQIWAILMFQAWRASVFTASPERGLGAITVDSNPISRAGITHPAARLLTSH